MRGVALSSLNCSIARTLDIVGERWTLLILRDAFNGVRRFEDFAIRLPVARNVLTVRLQRLVAHGILTRERYQERPARYEYRLTAKGRELYPVLIGLLQWGDRHLAGAEGPPLAVVHRDCGHHVRAAVLCSGCGQTLSAREARGVRSDADGSAESAGS
jgi:DNA-binding HxlR family transcriptional regulator